MDQIMKRAGRAESERVRMWLVMARSVAADGSSAKKRRRGKRSRGSSLDNMPTKNWTTPTQLLQTLEGERGGEISSSTAYHESRASGVHCSTTIPGLSPGLDAAGTLGGSTAPKNWEEAKSRRHLGF